MRRERVSWCGRSGRSWPNEKLTFLGGDEIVSKAVVLRCTESAKSSTTPRESAHESTLHFKEILGVGEKGSVAIVEGFVRLWRGVGRLAHWVAVGLAERDKKAGREGNYLLSGRRTPRSGWSE